MLFPDTKLWKVDVYEKFKEQKDSLKSVQTMVKTQENLRAKVAALQKYNRSIELQLSDLKKSGTGYSSTGSSSPSINSDAQERIQKLQEELTACYKRNSEDATAMLTLTNQVQKQQAAIIEKDETIEQLQIDKERLVDLCKMRENEAKANDEKYHTIKKELETTQDAYKVLETQKTTLDKEFNELLNRWMQKVEEDAKKMNLANELYTSMVSLQKSDEVMRRGKEIGETVTIDTSSIGCLSPLPTDVKKVFPGHKGEVNYCKFSNSGTILATGGTDRYVTLWDTSSYSRQATLAGAGQSIMCTSFSLGDEYVLGSSNDNTIRIWKVDTQRLQYTLTSHIGKVYTAEFTGDGTKVISGSHDRTLKVWDLTRGGKCLRTIFCNSSCNDICLPLEGTMICSVHLDSNIRLWDSRSSDKPTDVLENIHSKQITSVSLGPDGKTVLTCSRDNTLKLIDLKMNETLKTFQHPTFRTETNWNRACLSPDGAMAIGGSSNGSVYIWDTTNGQLKTILEGKHQRAINAMGWSNQGEVCSADRSGVIAIWK